MVYLIYNLIRYVLIYPFLILFSIFKKEKKIFFFKRINQNLNIIENKETIWIHCSSMGETNLSEPLIRNILKEREENILVSVFTDTGYENAKNRYKDNDRVNVIYFPLDDYFLLKKIKEKIKLKLLIVIETEIWPNLIKIGTSNSKMIFVNGRISDKSFPRYLKFRNIFSNLFKNVDGFYMQSNQDMERIIEIGAKKEKVENTGNLKFCINFEKYSNEEKNELKKIINAKDRKILVFGSTRETEEEKIISNIEIKKDRLLIIVPRHLTRLEEVEAVLMKHSLNYIKFSELEIDKKEIDVQAIIVDKMGILRKFYSICDVAFVGGTLINVGGHSLLEPLFYGKTPIFGPFLQNVKEISRELLEKNIGIKIQNESELEEKINSILDNKSKIEEIEKIFINNSDVVKKILEKIKKLI